MAEDEAKPGPSKRRKLEGDVPLDTVKDIVQNITSPTLMIGPEVQTKTILQNAIKDHAECVR